MSDISLANHSNIVHLIPSYMERLLPF